MTLPEARVVLVEAGQAIPDDGQIIEGAALVDELAITGQTDPILCDAGGPRSEVVAGAQVLSGRILIRIAMKRR
jgi:K+-transporting ATPase ATPase B chain